MMSLSPVTELNQPVTFADPDLGLVEAAKAGSIIAFEELVRRHEQRMFRIAHNLLHNREDAQDVVQEAFLKAFQRLVQFQARSKFSTWLARITLNEALTKLRKEPVYWSSIDQDCGDQTDNLPQEIADWSPNPEMLYTASELREILEKNLRRLNPKLQAVFLLHDVEELSLEETAQSLGLSVPAVKARSWRARLQLREWLNHSFRKDSHAATISPGHRRTSHV